MAPGIDRDPASEPVRAGDVYHVTQLPARHVMEVDGIRRLVHQAQSTAYAQGPRLQPSISVRNPRRQRRPSPATPQTTPAMRPSTQGTLGLQRRPARQPGRSPCQRAWSLPRSWGDRAHHRHRRGQPRAAHAVKTMRAAGFPVSSGARTVRAMVPAVMEVVRCDR